jgi:hypothetical protein
LWCGSARLALCQWRERASAPDAQACFCCAQLVIAFVISAVIEPMPMPLPPKKAN